MAHRVSPVLGEIQGAVPRSRLVRRRERWRAASKGLSGGVGAPSNTSDERSFSGRNESLIVAEQMQILRLGD